MDTNELYVMYGDKSKEIAKALLKKAAIERDITSNMLIGIKPNLVLSKPSDSGATTCPELVKGVIEYLKECGFENICILESSWIGDDTEKAYKVCGYQDIAQQYNVPLIDLKKDDYETFNDYLNMKVCKKAIEIDYLINMPVLKAHCQTKITCALKNLKGCIPDSEKRRFHTLGLHKPIAYLGKILKNDFIVVDGIVGDLTYEEGGTPVKMNRVIVGKDPVLVDSYAAQLLGYDSNDIKYINMARDLQVGSGDLESSRIIHINKDSTNVKAIKATNTVKQLAKHITEKQACSACYGSLIHALARLEDKGELGRIKERIHIGQGHKGTKGKGIGVGQCTADYEKCIGGCPPTAGAIVKFLLGLDK